MCLYTLVKLVQYYVKAAKANYIKLISGCMFTSCLSDFDFNVNTTLAGALKGNPTSVWFICQVFFHWSRLLSSFMCTEVLSSSAEIIIMMMMICPTVLFLRNVGNKFGIFYGSLFAPNRNSSQWASVLKRLCPNEWSSVLTNDFEVFALESRGASEKW